MSLIRIVFASIHQQTQPEREPPMKPMKKTILTSGITLAAVLLLSACKDSDPAAQGPGQESAAVAGNPSETGAAAKIIEEPSEEQLAAAKPYPLEVCLVSDEALDSMGDPVVLVIGTQQVKLCCNHCMDDLKKDTSGYLAKLQK